MKMLLALAIVAFSSLVSVPLTLTPARAANACSFRPVPPADRVYWSAEGDWARLIVIGVVVDEAIMANDYSYESRMQTLATLRGEAPAGDLVLTGLSDESDCGNGPRLNKGEFVMLLMGVRQDGSWLISGLGGKIVFKDGQAYLNDKAGSPEADLQEMMLLGSAEDVVTRVADIVQADPNARGAALAALRSHNTDTGVEWSPALLIAAMATTLLTFGGLSALLRSRRLDSPHREHASAFRPR